MRNFREYTIWTDSIILIKQTYQFTKHFPEHEKFGLKSQVQRAAVSIASNIAEGASRASEIDFARFLEIALGSSFEVETQMIIAKELEYIKEEELDQIIANLNKLQKQINHLITKIRKPKPIANS